MFDHIGTYIVLLFFFYRNTFKDNKVIHFLKFICITMGYKLIYLNLLGFFYSTVISSHQSCSKVRRNVTDNNYETPHHYTEIQVEVYYRSNCIFPGELYIKVGIKEKLRIQNKYETVYQYCNICISLFSCLYSVN